MRLLSNFSCEKERIIVGDAKSATDHRQAANRNRTAENRKRVIAFVSSNNSLKFDIRKQS